VKKTIGTFHLLTDTVNQERYTHLELAELALAGGADVIQLRDKRLPTGSLVTIATGVHERCARHGVPLIINDRVDVAMAVDADGVHLGLNDVPVAVARDLLGPDKIIGATAPTVEDAQRAEADGADYIGFGHMYPTRSKDKPMQPKRPDELRAVCEAVSIPVISIGGITAERVGDVVAAGADGVAAIGSVCGDPDPELAARGIRDAIDRAVDSRGVRV